MKTVLYTLMALLLSSSVLAKVTYEDALESNADYDAAMEAVDNDPDDQGLTDGEIPDGNQSEYGHWQKLSSKPATTSFIRLSGNSTGHECSPKGAYGMDEYQESHSGDAPETYYDYYYCE